jgi:hypothetical protein
MTRNTMFGLMMAAATLAGCGTAPKTVAGTQSSALACTVDPAPRPRIEDEGCRDIPPPSEARHKLFHQLRYHQSFPISAAGLRDALRGSLELDADEMTWISARLPSRAFTSGAEVFRAVLPDAPRETLARVAAPLLAQR